MKQISIIILIFLLGACVSRKDISHKRDLSPKCTQKQMFISDTVIAILEELNLARTNPKLYAQFIREKKERNDKEANIAIRYLESVVPRMPLVLVSCLCLSAQDHVDDIGTKGIVSHKSSDGSDFEHRISRYVSHNRCTTAENISFGHSDARDIIIELILSPGHRDNMFNISFNSVGLAFGFHLEYRTMCVQKFSSCKIRE